MEIHEAGNPVLVKCGCEVLVSFDVIPDSLPFVPLSPILSKMYALSRTAKIKYMHMLM